MSGGEWPPASLFREEPHLLVSSPAKPGATRDSMQATKARAEAHQAPQPPGRGGAQKGISACQPPEGVRPGRAPDSFLLEGY